MGKRGEIPTTQQIENNQLCFNIIIYSYMQRRWLHVACVPLLNVNHSDTSSSVDLLSEGIQIMLSMIF